MPFSFEFLIILGVLGFYLYDSAILVFSNEIIFNESNGRWFVSFPTDRWRLIGKLLFFPNPLTPSNLIFVAKWSSTENLSEQKVNDMSELRIAIKYLRVAVVLLMFLLAIVLPFVIFKLGIGGVALIVLLLIYILILGMLFYTYIKRDKLRLNKKLFSSMAFEAISCPPFAINWIRKITLQQQLCNCPVEFASKNLEIEDFKCFIKELDKKLSEELEYENEEDGPHSIEIIKYREKLMSMLP